MPPTTDKTWGTEPAFPNSKTGTMWNGNIGTTTTSGITLRQYAAIHLSVPDSGNPDLDEMIMKANEIKFAIQYGAHSTFEKLNM